ncbi:GtrA family protein [Methylovirgula sp. HY1]|uniref:GtrA family protein n=1 Tax=Methylovirgula sp. HY1 TaxID=2822761 RepID=UPI001C5A6693|nr:GtrA family protein [Methylovirgula sp. HY1]QXX75211.1 hypothetical protein MHY1_02030 [Methylovirgula sp. HY1]
MSFRQSIMARAAALRNARVRLLAPNFLGDLWRYGLCSVVALAVDWGLLIGLVRAGMNYLPAATASFLVGMVVAYVGSIIFVYRGRRPYPLLVEAIGFFLIGFAGLFINILLLYAFVQFFGLSAGLAKAPTAVGVFLFNFLMRRTLLFIGAPGVAMLPDEVPPPIARY